MQSNDSTAGTLAGSIPGLVRQATVLLDGWVVVALRDVEGVKGALIACGDGWNHGDEMK